MFGGRRIRMRMEHAAHLIQAHGQWRREGLQSYGREISQMGLQQSVDLGTKGIGAIFSFVGRHEAGHHISRIHFHVLHWKH